MQPESCTAITQYYRLSRQPRSSSTGRLARIDSPLPEPASSQDGRCCSSERPRLQDQQQLAFSHLRRAHATEMTDSVSLVTAQISFLDLHLALIHIDIDLYPLFVQPILQLLFGEDHDADAATIPWTNRHDFLNVSITPEGCSIICTRHLAETLFVPIRDQFSKTAPQLEIVDEDYIVIQVDGQGLDAGQRVLELTSPLAMAGISIFFITTYFSDYILVPLRARRTVTNALEQRGFVFSQSADAFVSQLSPSLPFSAQQHLQYQQRNASSPPGSSGNGNSMPSTPPAKDIPELQRRTFAKLQKHHIAPLVDRDLRLLNCAGNSDDPAHDATLQNDLLQVLLAISPGKLRRPSLTSNTKQAPPQPNGNGNGASHHKPIRSSSSAATFLSITLTATEPISLFLERRLLPRLGRTLLGASAPEDPRDTLVPVTFDLAALPMEATGIVCGVAGCLAAGLESLRELGHAGFGRGGGHEDGREESEGEQGPVEVTFLSTAKAGTVLVKESDLERALRALEFGLAEAARRV